MHQLHSLKGRPRRRHVPTSSTLKPNCRPSANNWSIFLTKRIEEAQPPRGCPQGSRLRSGSPQETGANLLGVATFFFSFFLSLLGANPNWVCSLLLFLLSGPPIFEDLGDQATSGQPAGHNPDGVCAQPFDPPVSPKLRRSPPLHRIYSPGPRRTYR